MDSSKSKIGLYETIITDSVNRELQALDGGMVSVQTKKFTPLKPVIV